MSDEPVDEGHELRSGEEGRFAATWQNKAAGRALRAARQGVTQSDFAAALSRDLGVPISATALSGWETGRRQVPAPVWLAAAMVSKQSLDATLADSGAPEAVSWAEGLGLSQRMESQAADLRKLREELAELRQQYATFYTDVIQAFSRAGVSFRPSRQAAGGATDQRRQRGTAG
jgi:transcriptional regulator with XRE-family HTH domain